MRWLAERAGLISAIVYTVGVLITVTVHLSTVTTRGSRLHDVGFARRLALLRFIVKIVPPVLCTMPTSPNALQHGPGTVPQHPGAPVPQQGRYPHYPQQ